MIDGYKTRQRWHRDACGTLVKSGPAVVTPVDWDADFLAKVREFALRSEEHRVAVLEAIGCGSPR